MPHVHHLGAALPWPGTDGVPEIPQREIAPRRGVAYKCARGCTFTVTFAAEAEPPDDWECRCGRPARREGAPEGTGGTARLPGYQAPGSGRYERADPVDTTPMGQLRKRRSAKEGAAILAEALAAVRESGAAR